MNITVHEFRIGNGCHFNKIRCASHRRHLAIECIADDGRRHWNQADHTAGVPVPEDDAEVIRLYFKDKPEDENKFVPSYWIDERSYEIDLAPAGDVSLSGEGVLTLRIDPHVPGIASTGTLIPTAAPSAERDIVDTLESFILRLACAGFPVQAPEFQQCVTETLTQLADMDMLGETEENECA